MDRDTLIDKTVTAANGAIIALAIFMVVFLLIQAFILNNAYTYGKELQKRCGVEYLEKETPNYQIHKAFVEKVEKNFHKIFYGFAVLFMIVTSILTILFIYILANLGPENWQTYYTLFLGTAIPILLLFSITIVRKTSNPTIDYILHALLLPILLSQLIGIENKYLFGLFNFISLVIFSIIVNSYRVKSLKDFIDYNRALFTTYFIYYFALIGIAFIKTDILTAYRDKKWLQILTNTIISGPIFALFGFLLYIWGSTLSGKINAAFKVVSPFAKPEIPIKETIYAHLTHLGSILITIILAYVYINKVLYLSDDNYGRKFLKVCLIAVIILIALMPLTSYFMYNITIKNVKYSDSIDKINENIKGILESDTDPVVVNNLLRNIINAEGRNDPTFDAPTLLQKGLSKDSDIHLSDYIKHSENYVDIHSIIIPSDLSEDFIKPEFLEGDNVVYLKNALVQLYYECNQKSYNTSRVYISKNYHINNEPNKKDTFDKALSILAPYLKDTIEDLLMQTDIPDTRQNDITIKQNLLDTLNRTVIHNKSTFDKANVLPREIYSQLREMREEKTLENNTHSFYAYAKGIIYSSVILLSYIVFHTIYSKNPDFAGKAIAGALILLIIFICYVGFFTKDIWL